MKPVFTLIFLCCIILHTHGQIVYTDVNPDQTFNTIGSVYHLDLNNDGINDFDISYTTQVVTVTGNCHGTGTDSSIRITPLNQNEIAGDSVPNAFNGWIIESNVIESNVIIDHAAFTWESGTNQTLASKLWECLVLRCKMCGYGAPLCCTFYFGLGKHGHWPGAVNKYIALRLHAGSNIYYGWVRLDVDSTRDSFTIKDYAYNSIPNQPILAGQSTTLPVTLLSFSGFLKNNQSVLSWSTANEINNKGFDVERSEDGKNFIAIGFVNGKGNTSSVSDYNFTDTKLKSPANFYRLKQIDNDGKFSYSAVVQINYGKIDANQITITPNPFSNSTTISFTLPQSQKVSISIYDMTGRLVKTLANTELQQGTQQLTWNAKDEKGNTVNAGIYFLKMQAGNYTETRKVIAIK